MAAVKTGEIPTTDLELDDRAQGATTETNERSDAVTLPLRLVAQTGRSAECIEQWAAALLRSGQDATEIKIADFPSMEIPTVALRFLAEVLDDLADGRAITVAPFDLPIGTEASSDVLGVSRTWLAKLLDDKKLPSERAGTKRRVRLGDLIAFRRSDDRKRRPTNWEFLDDED